MRKSSLIKLVLLGGGALAVGGCCVCAGMGNDDENQAVIADNDPQWYDANGNPIPTAFTTDEHGRKVPVGDPRDRFGHPLRFDDAGNRLLAATAGAAVGSGYRSSGYRRSSGLFPFWSSRSTSSYGGGRSPTGAGSGGSTYFGGSHPGTSSAPRSSPSVGGSVSRGGFGSGASASS